MIKAVPNPGAGKERSLNIYDAKTGFFGSTVYKLKEAVSLD